MLDVKVEASIGSEVARRLPGVYPPDQSSAYIGPDGVPALSKTSWTWYSGIEAGPVENGCAI